MGASVSACTLKLGHLFLVSSCHRPFSLGVAGERLGRRGFGSALPYPELPPGTRTRATLCNSARLRAKWRSARGVPRFMAACRSSCPSRSPTDSRATTWRRHANEEQVREASLARTLESLAHS